MSYNYLLLDLPSHHEVEWVLATECDSIRGILANKLRGPKVKHVHATTQEGLQKTVPQRPYLHVKYVHLAPAGNRDAAQFAQQVRRQRLSRPFPAVLRRLVAPLRRKRSNWDVADARAQAIQ